MIFKCIIHTCSIWFTKQRRFKDKKEIRANRGRGIDYDGARPWGRNVKIFDKKGVTDGRMSCNKSLISWQSKAKQSWREEYMKGENIEWKVGWGYLCPIHHITYSTCKQGNKTRKNMKQYRQAREKNGWHEGLMDERLLRWMNQWLEEQMKEQVRKTYNDGWRDVNKEDVCFHSCTFRSKNFLRVQWKFWIKYNWIYKSDWSSIMSFENETQFNTML